MGGRTIVLFLEHKLCQLVHQRRGDPPLPASVQQQQQQQLQAHGKPTHTQTLLKIYVLLDILLFSQGMSADPDVTKTAEDSGAARRPPRVGPIRDRKQLHQEPAPPGPVMFSKPKVAQAKEIETLLGEIPKAAFGKTGLELGVTKDDF